VLWGCGFISINLAQIVLLLRERQVHRSKQDLSLRRLWGLMGL
jgi:hypothetical protein